MKCAQNWAHPQHLIWACKSPTAHYMIILSFRNVNRSTTGKWGGGSFPTLSSVLAERSSSISIVPIHHFFIGIDQVYQMIKCLNWSKFRSLTIMYCLWISVFSCANFSHSSFKLHGRHEFIISDLYMLIAGLGDSILIYDPPSLINNDRQLERVQWSMIHWPWHHPFRRPITPASALLPPASVHRSEDKLHRLPLLGKVAPKKGREVHTWSSKEKVVVWIRTTDRAVPLINSAT